MKSGLFNHDTLTVNFGGPLSVEKNKFTASAIKVADYKYKRRERESLGNGWYGGTEVNEYEQTNEYLIHRDGKVLGIMNPYAKEHTGCKSSLQEFNPNKIPQRYKQIADANKLIF